MDMTYYQQEFVLEIYVGILEYDVSLIEEVNISNFKNNGVEYRKSKELRKVLGHDFPIAELGKL